MFGKHIIFTVLCVIGLCYGRAADNRPRVHFSDEVTRKVFRAIEQCIAETGIEKSVLQLVRDGKYEENEIFKKYIYCSYVKSGYANEDGHLKVKETAAVFPEEYDMLTVITNCDKEQNDPVENTFYAFKCFQETSPVLMGL